MGALNLWCGVPGAFGTATTLKDPMSPRLPAQIQFVHDVL